ncbi:MAG TPA: oxygenase MpaB family protein [Acidimicrobiia bacterium]|nr:oxygenase MpaB family protein [Acidimicrobiia bacterium]
MEGDDRPLGPTSVAWGLHASPAMLTAGLRALLLQLWHPSIASAVTAHSEVARDPWSRYRATVAFITSVTYGDDDEANDAVRRVRGVHAKVRGVDVRGASYAATDPELLAYVHATLVDSALQAADVYGPRLSCADRDRYVVEMARVAELLGLADPPRDAASAYAVIDRSDAAGVSRPGRDLAWLLALPPLPLWMRAPYGLLFASAVDLLPRQCAVDLGLLPVWGPVRPAVRASNAAMLQTASLAVGWSPMRRAWRAVARRSFASA